MHQSRGDRARRSLAASAFALLLLFTIPVPAHDVPPSILDLSIGRNSLDIEIQLPLSELGAALSLPLAQAPSQTIKKFGKQIGDYVQQHLQVHSKDGRRYVARLLSMEMRQTSNANWLSNDWLIAHVQLTAPASASTEIFSLDDQVILDTVVTHKALVYVKRDIRNGLLGDRPAAIGLISFQNTRIDVDGSAGSWWRGFQQLLRLGMEHIATGTDHLLFLIVLLLPAPLMVSAGKWQSGKPIGATVRTIVTTITGFTLGHSLTLAWASAGWIAIPSRPIEVMIAVSIIVSCWHAWRPLFAGKEAWIALGFGLIHGLAFATTLSGLNFDRWTLAVSLAGFNLGIEAMQFLVVLIVLPLLIALATTRCYGVIRLLGAGVAGLCALGWIGERAFNIVNPLPSVASWLEMSPHWLLVALCALPTWSYGRRMSRLDAELTVRRP